MKIKRSNAKNTHKLLVDAEINLRDRIRLWEGNENPQVIRLYRDCCAQADAYQAARRALEGDFESLARLSRF